MNYPQRFFTKMFSAGRPLELARRFAIWSGALVLLISIAAGAVWWARRSQSVRPYFMFIDSDGAWRVLASKPRTAVPWYELLQESLVRRIASDWFLITDNMAENNAVLWEKCETCGEDNWNKCRIRCASGGGAFDDFAKNIVPKWRAIFGAGGTQKLDDLAVEKIDAGKTGGLWKITGVIRRSNASPRKIIGNMRIERGRVDPGRGWAQTLGFYVAEFDWYGE